MIHPEAKILDGECIFDSVLHRMRSPWSTDLFELKNLFWSSQAQDGIFADVLGSLEEAIEDCLEG
jgi:hypothetical protein